MLICRVQITTGNSRHYLAIFHFYCIIKSAVQESYHPVSDFQLWQGKVRKNMLSKRKPAKNEISNWKLLLVNQTVFHRKCIEKFFSKYFDFTKSTY